MSCLTVFSVLLFPERRPPSGGAEVSEVPNSRLHQMKRAVTNRPIPTISRTSVPPKGKPPAQPTQKGDGKPKEKPLKKYPPPKEKVTHRCGHAFTPQEINKRDCPHCCRKRAAARRQKQMSAHAHSATNPASPPVYRLPPGSVKIVTWDGKVWHGQMAVPGVPEQLRFGSDTEKKCFHGLHALYVEHMAAKLKKEKGESPTPTPETAPGVQGGETGGGVQS